MLRPGVLLIVLALLSAGTPVFAKQKACENILAAPLILREDIAPLAQVAKDEQLVMMVMAPNPASLPYSLHKGYVAKTAELKPCKSAVSGAAAGLVQCPPEIFSSMEDWQNNKAALKQMGYSILDAEHHYLVKRDSDGKLFYSDYDMLGLYHAGNGQPAYTEELRYLINSNLGRRLVRHGPLDDYAERAKIKVKFPVLVFFPDQSMREVRSEAELRQIYAQFNISWKM